jgi:hypothetical protein
MDFGLRGLKPITINDNGPKIREIFRTRIYKGYIEQITFKDDGKGSR